MSPRDAAVRVGAGTLVLGAIAAWLVLRGAPALEAERVQPLPPWFGDATRPASRIAGTVIGAQHAMTVHLLLDIPDVSSWKGPQVRTSNSGAFDFGPMRPGRYIMFVEGDGAFSRLTRVNTLREPGEHVELFAYERATVERTVEMYEGHFLDNDWEVPHEFLKTSKLWSWPHVKPISGTILHADGTVAAGLGVQPIECSQCDHCVPAGLPMVATTDADGKFTVFSTGEDVCGIRVLMGPTSHEAKVMHSQRTVIRLPKAGAEEHGVFDRRSRDVGDPRGAWIRGQVLRDGKGVPDVDLTAMVLPLENMEVEDNARTRSDGTFELYISSRDLDESHDVLIEARQSVRHLAGRQVIQLAPGQNRDDLEIEVGAGFAVSGVVVDEKEVPVAGARVECEPWRKDSSPTGEDGAFRLVIPTQGRCRLHAMFGYGEELTPVASISPKVDVTRPDGDLAGFHLVVQRNSQRHIESIDFRGLVDLGARLKYVDVAAVGDELEAAGLRVGDTIVAATQGGQPLESYVLFVAATPPWGEDVTLTVKRGSETIDIHAKAPTFDEVRRFDPSQ